MTSEASVRPRFNLIQAILLSILPALLASCGKDELRVVDPKLLSTDIHLSIADHALVLPFVALNGYPYQSPSFTSDEERAGKGAEAALKEFLRRSVDSQKPLVVDGVSAVVSTYGWHESRSIRVCALLSRDWARSVCDNPWAATQQALPSNSFRLVDLRQLKLEDQRGPAHCRQDGMPPRSLPSDPGEAAIVCTAQLGGHNNEFHHAVVRIDGDLGALWMVWRYGQNGETAEAMTEREGKAIVAFVRYALGRSEDFPRLQAEMCRARRPGSTDGPNGAEYASGQPTLKRLVATGQ